MSAALHPDVLEAIERIDIQSLTTYTCEGQPRDLSNRMIPVPRLQPGNAQTPANDDRERLLQALEYDLYTRLYTRPQQNGGAPKNDPVAQRDHVNALSIANSGRGTWEPGWRIGERDEDGMVAVTKDNITFWVDPQTGLRTVTGRVTPGEFCRVLVTKELRNLMPGFYFAIGDGDQSDARDVPEALVRFYWHLTPAAAASYIATVTRTLNGLAVPFRTKVLTDPSSYVRADAGVLYLERRHFHRVRAALLQVHASIAPLLRDAVPMYTKRLAPGLGVAEDPGNGLSFGMSRSRVIANGLVTAFENASSREETVAGVCAENGIDVERPWLDRGSPDIYLLEVSTRNERRAAERALRKQERKQRRIGQ